MTAAAVYVENYVCRRNSRRRQVVWFLAAVLLAQLSETIEIAPGMPKMPVVPKMPEMPMPDIYVKPEPSVELHAQISRILKMLIQDAPPSQLFIYHTKVGGPTDCIDYFQVSLLQEICGNAEADPPSQHPEVRLPAADQAIMKFVSLIDEIYHHLRGSTTIQVIYPYNDYCYDFRLTRRKCPWGLQFDPYLADCSFAIPYCQGDWTKEDPVDEGDHLPPIDRLPCCTFDREE